MWYTGRVDQGPTIAPTATAWLPLSIGLAGAFLAATQYAMGRALLSDWPGLRVACQLLLRRPQPWLAAVLLVTAHVLLTRGLGTQGHEHLNVSTFLVNVVYGGGKPTYPVSH